MAHGDHTIDINGARVYVIYARIPEQTYVIDGHPRVQPSCDVYVAETPVRIWAERIVDAMSSESRPMRIVVRQEEN